MKMPKAWLRLSATPPKPMPHFRAWNERGGSLPPLPHNVSESPALTRFNGPQPIPSKADHASSDQNLRPWPPAAEPPRPRPRLEFSPLRIETDLRPLAAPLRASRRLAPSVTYSKGKTWQRVAQRALRAIEPPLRQRPLPPLPHNVDIQPDLTTFHSG